MPLTPGSRLGPYEIIAQLGQGGMGIVFRARDTKLEREVAVKVLPRNLAEDPDALARFEREAKAVAALSHPNILAIHDFGREEGTVYAAMELLEGETLRQRLQDGALPTRKAVEIALEIAGGLAAAHEKGIVHRDLKPENVFLLGSGQVKVLDFGLARMDPVAPEAARRADDVALDGAGPGDGHRGLHGPRAGARQGGGRPRRHLLVRGRALRDAHRQEGLPGREPRGDPQRYPQGGPAQPLRVHAATSRPRSSASCAAASRSGPRSASAARTTSPSRSTRSRPPRRAA